MRENLVIDGNAVYEIDVDCMEQLERKREREKKAFPDGTKSNLQKKGYSQRSKK